MTNKEAAEFIDGVLDGVKSFNEEGGRGLEALDLAIKALKNERPQGEWIEKEETPASVSYYCSVCKTEGIPITPFCPWCGAKMKGGTE